MKFYKYQGTGNDFIILDDRSGKFPLHNRDLVAKLCHRRFGIGADGLMLLRNEAGYDFRMIYFNADGNISSMCGNGGRCLVRFAQLLGIVKDKAVFLAADGRHEAIAEKEVVKLKMNDVNFVEVHENHLVMNTGSPHYVSRVKDLAQLDIVPLARNIRYNPTYKAGGINVNFIEEAGQAVSVRTYERGVEDETLSCGTGVTASAIAHAIFSALPAGHHEVPILSPGGALRVTFDSSADARSFSNIWLIGPADLVFSGEMSF